MKDFDNLTRLVKSLQSLITDNKLSVESVKKSKEELGSLGYKYDVNLFPELKTDAKFSSVIGSAPSNLAEALLWKMGKWNVYKEFINNYNSTGPLTKTTDVVFTAFAKHLKDSSNPIYDQHALRAMWAINTKLNEQEKNKCKSALFK
jgi:hypothetical protein